LHDSDENRTRWPIGHTLEVIRLNASEEKLMLQLALIFLIVALVAGVLGLTGIAGISANIAWILFVVGLVLALVMFVMGRRPSI
jgi:uncharacterized membrane protein YtjA (UPF0391 family)